MPSPAWYATHRPFGEKTALVGNAEDVTSPKRDALRSGIEKVQSVVAESFIVLNKKTSWRGAQDSGTCDVPGSGRVNRSAGPPSTGCQKIARSPSRSDWKATRFPSADQIGRRLFPPNVSRRRELLPARSYSEIIASFPSFVSSAIRLPSGETLGNEYEPGGNFRAVTAPLRS